MTAPEPLVPAECTMAGNDWFPLHFDRLRKSKWWRRASDLARARNVMLWGEAYKQIPAGSMPDDDDELAEAAGFGMDVDTFISAKAEIMAPWVLCADGRWYHPTVCEVVLDAWERSSERKKAAAERQRKRREKVKGITPTTPRVTPKADPVTPAMPLVTRDDGENARDFGIQTLQTGQDTEDADASLPPSGGLKPSYPTEFETCWKAYPHVRGRSSKSKALAQWRRLPRDQRAALPSAIARYAAEGREPRADCGAPALERWLRDGRFADWIAGPDTAAPSTPPCPWRHRARLWKGNRYWESEWGPRPGQPGCECPDEVLREFGLEPAQLIAGAA